MPEKPNALSQSWQTGDRPELPDIGDERTVMTAFLDWHRATLVAKCGGLSTEQLNMRSVPPSTMSLHGLVRHLSGGERWWFRIHFAGEQVPLLYYSDEDPDQDFDDLDGDVTRAFEVWRSECDRSRKIVAAAGSLDVVGTCSATGQRFSLRRVMAGMLAEYARHNGHADLLRERIDGVTGH